MAETDLNKPEPTLTQPAALAMREDALDHRDAWRTIWQWVSGNGMLALLLMLVCIALLAAALLPQSPSKGELDPAAFGEWQSATRAFAGPLQPALQSLGLFGVYGSNWFVALLLATLSIVMARTIDRLLAWLRPAIAEGTRTDETRILVSDLQHGLTPPDGLGANWQIRGQKPGSWFALDRGPKSHASTLLLHTGMALGLAGALIGARFGWQDPRAQLIPDSQTLLAGRVPAELVQTDVPMGSARITLPDGTWTLQLGERSRNIAGITLMLREFVPVIRVSAVNTSGKPQMLAESTYSSPGTEVLIAFRAGESERAVAVPDENLLVIFEGGQAGRWRTLSMPGGRELESGNIAPIITTGGLRIALKQESGAIVSASAFPGLALMLAGLLLALIGLILTRLFPRQHVLVRRHDETWIEFFASGGNVRGAVRKIAAMLAEAGTILDL